MIFGFGEIWFDALLYFWDIHVNGITLTITYFCISVVYPIELCIEFIKCMVFLFTNVVKFFMTQWIRGLYC